MRKLFTLLTLLVAIVTGAWGEDETLFSMSVKSTVSTEATSEGGKKDATYVLTNYADFSVSNTSAVFQQMEKQGNNGAKYIGNQNNSYWFCIASGGDKVHFILTLSKAIEEGDVISYDVYGAATDKSYGLLFNKELATTGVGPTAESPTTAKTTLHQSYTVKSGDVIVGKKTIYVTRAAATSTYFNNLVITRPEVVPTLTGAWSSTSNEIYQGDAAPSIPTFSVGASNNSTPAAAAYNVAYSLKQGSTAGIVTLNANSGITAISNGTVGTATVIATLTTENAENYLTPASNTFEYTVTVKAKNPEITLNKESITLKSTPVTRAASTTVTLNGLFLTGASGTVSWSDVDGLTINPTEFTITDGAASQEFTITYNKDVATSGNVDVTFSDGTTSKVLPVSYNSVVAHAWRTVSSDETWDWSMATGDDIDLNDNTTPKKNSDVDIVAADFDGDIYEYNAGFPENFDAIVMNKFQRPKNGSYYQGTTLKIKTSTPGKLVVTFANTGSKRPNRYLQVNGTIFGEGSGDGASAAQRTVTVPVDKGEIVMTGIYEPNVENYSAASGYQDFDADLAGQPAFLNYYKVEFTAMPSSVNGTITASGYNTYSTNYPIDLSTITGGMAYVATGVTDGKVVLTKCTSKVPAATGLFIAGTAGETFTISTTDEATTAPSTNLFVAKTNGGEVAKAANGEYNYVFGWTEETNPGFYLIGNTAAQLSAFKAYLHTTDPLSATSQARMGFLFVDELTGISQIESKTKSVDGAIYNLSGQRVAQPTKGLYIVNGKKYINQ